MQTSNLCGFCLLARIVKEANTNKKRVEIRPHKGGAAVYAIAEGQEADEVGYQWIPELAERCTCSGEASELPPRPLEHTPGPWFVLADPVWRGKHPCHDWRYIATSQEAYTFEHRDTHRDPAWEKSWRFCHPDASIICTLTDQERQPGNAALIAAAPDLLSACKAALQCQADPLDEGTIDALECAIAKATTRPKTYDAQP